MLVYLGVFVFVVGFNVIVDVYFDNVVSRLMSVMVLKIRFCEMVC